MTLTDDSQSARYDLAIVGANRAGLSVAEDAAAGGLKRILVLDAGENVPPDLGAHVEIRTAAPVADIVDGPVVSLSGPGLEVTATVAVVAARSDIHSVAPPYQLPSSLSERIHFELPETMAADEDVLVVGAGETAAVHIDRLVASGHRSLVLTLPSVAFDRLSSRTRDDLLWLERESRATIFWHSLPTGVLDVDGFPLVEFSDRRTPDLVFDRIVYALGTDEPSHALDRLDIGFVAAEHDASVVVLTDTDPEPGAEETHLLFASPGRAWKKIRRRFFPELEVPHDLDRRPALVIAGLAEKLRDKNYNATITSFENHHSDLWILRVRPDVGQARHEPGQYATLALGYWEPRLDGIDEKLDEVKVEKLVRRSYSISHPMLDDAGRLLGPDDIDGVEFYIVLVRPEGMEHLPELTPRLALKNAGDRIFMGPKVAGRYTLKSVTDPDQDVIFLATGTGEAPHNNMLAELLRSGHRGRIVNACTVRYERDLAYLSTHRRLEEMFPNYRYIGLTTREADTIDNKVYIQDLITRGMLADALGHEPTPERSEFFLCGNPLMIGLPVEGDDGERTWPESRGVCEILTGLGFTIDRRGVEGNVHFEEYW